jgi:hypothetical protein
MAPSARRRLASNPAKRTSPYLFGRAAQQHGYVHAGAIAAIADSANGYAALSSALPIPVLAVEFKITSSHPARSGSGCGPVLRQGVRCPSVSRRSSAWRFGPGGHRDDAFDHHRAAGAGRPQKAT